MKRLLIILLWHFMALLASGKPHEIAIIANTENDIYNALVATPGLNVMRFDSIDELLESSTIPQAVIITASDYPHKRVDITPHQYTRISSLNTGVYVEFPSYVPQVTLPDTLISAPLERGVITTSSLGNSLPAMSILGLNGCDYIPVAVDGKKTLMVSAKIAGFDKAVFGLDNTPTHPLLFTAGKQRLVATTRLSQYNSSRFGPTKSWNLLWDHIIGYLLGDSAITISHQPPSVCPALQAHDIVDTRHRHLAITRGAQWVEKACLLIDTTWEDSWIARYQSVNGDPNRFFGPPLPSSFPIGDGSRGIMEGHGSTILADGRQLYRYFTRADVQGESAMLFAGASRYCQEEKYRSIASNLLDYLFINSVFRKDDRNDRNSPAYGYLSWANTHPGTFYGDDNARCILGAIAASTRLGNDNWDKYIVENILANLRTASSEGFQGNMIRQKELIDKGWQYFSNRHLANPHPHFESWMWACYLWLYDKTGYKPLYDKAVSAIRLTMEAYPDSWHVQNGIQQERARMILPLAWLVRVDDTPQHRQWLGTIVDKLLEFQEECGAIREELGDNTQDTNGFLVTSNEAYGRTEASLIAINGDPVADMLYTCNFAFMALNEAAHSTGNPTYHNAVKKLADFLVRIQATSTTQPDLDGAWFRAFDYNRWDYWASNADNGWGAWCTLTGWIQSWILSTQILVDERSSFWDLTSCKNMNQALSNSVWMMF